MDDRQIYAWMDKHIPKQSPRILEIGAHHCEDSERFMTMFTTPKITAFEPDPRNVQAIRAKQLPLTLIEAAVGNLNGTVEFHLSGGIHKNQEWTFSSSVRRPKLHLLKHTEVKFIGTTTVNIVKLDTAMGADPGVIDFIWCDVQGNEADVIRGGLNTLRHTRYFYTEFDEHEMYEGQEGLHVLRDLLAGVFQDIGHYGQNVLFRNIYYRDL